jgi:hypothetical protein
VLSRHGVVVVLAAAGADLDLGGDQLARNRVAKDVVPKRGVTQLLEAVDEVERRLIEQRELLLDANREVGRLVEDLAPFVEVDARQVR